MKILFAVDRFPKISETFILNQVTGLIDRGHDVSIWAQERMPPAELSHQDVEDYQLRERTTYLPIPENRARRVFKTVLRAFRREGMGVLQTAKLMNPFEHGLYGPSMLLPNHYMAAADAGPVDIVHAHFGPVAQKAAVLKDAGLFRCPLVVSFHGHDVHTYVREHGRDVYDELFALTDRITTNSSYLREKVRDLGGENIVRHPAGLDPTKFPANYEQPGPAEPVKLVTVARLTEVKGIHYSVRAVARVLEKGLDVEYTIVGDGPQRRELRELIRDLGVGHSVRLSGPMTRREVAATLRQHQIFLLAGITSLDGATEGQGLVLQEAQASGLPVITTWNGGIPEGVVPGKSALLSPPRHVEEFSEHIAELATDAQRRISMGKAGREFVEQNFDIRKLNDRLVKIYEDAIEAYDAEQND
jgi:colanic acid/amylovoran biosynthesis glycosyltransferase